LEIGKAWKLTSSCVVCVFPTSYKNQNTINLYVRISSRKLGFLTNLFQETKLGSTTSSKVPSPLHTRNIFSLILVVGSKGHNLDPFNLFWELLMCVTEQIALFMGILKNDQWVFLIKIS
jgi:hypothetical protein